jgi:hypothetical protein
LPPISGRAVAPAFEVEGLRVEGLRVEIGDDPTPDAPQP